MAEMYDITIEKGQSIIDVAIHQYGSVEGIFLLLGDNPGKINRIDEPLAGGLSLAVQRDPDVTSKADMEYFRNLKDGADRPLGVNTGEEEGLSLEGIGFWIIGNDFEVQ